MISQSTLRSLWRVLEVATQSFAEQLNEVEMASVITFTRQAWGNDRAGDGEIVIPKDIVEYKQRDS